MTKHRQDNSFLRRASRRSLSCSCRARAMEAPRQRNILTSLCPDLSRISFRDTGLCCFCCRVTRDPVRASHEWLLHFVLPLRVLRGRRMTQVQPHKAAIPAAESEERQSNATDDNIPTGGPDGPGAAGSRPEGKQGGSEHDATARRARCCRRDPWCYSAPPCDGA